MNWLRLALTALACGCGAYAALVIFERRRKPKPRMQECEVCGKPADHRLIAHATDDARLAGGAVMGGTIMAADYCAEHCPGGCLQGCVASEP